MRMLLEDEDYQVSVLQQGKGAVERIREVMPDLVILDLKLADASGTDIFDGPSSADQYSGHSRDRLLGGGAGDRSAI